MESGLHEQVERLEAWQKQRLLVTYADLSAEPRYRRATAFFVDELYAPADLSQRDQDLERMYPFMVRMLPDKVLQVVASALELQGLTLELDLNVARVLHEKDIDPGPMTMEEYGMAYRALDNRAVREHQLELIMTVGTGLQRYVHNPMIYASLKMARPLAVMTGLEQLQQFLENGFTSFRDMEEADDFLGTIASREHAVLDALMNDELARIEHWFRDPQPRPAA